MSRRRVYYALLVALFIVGFALRWRYLSKVPAQNETVDEFAWTWSGMTLLQDGMPKAWSFLTPYGIPHFHFWHGYNFPMVWPWLDHPPLFSIVMGEWMNLAGFHDLYRVDLHYMRCLSVWLWVVSYLLLVFILPRYFDRGVILLGMLAFATAPVATINQRLVVSENFLTVLFLAGLLMLHNLAGRKWPAKSALLVGLLLVAFALPFSKLAAVGLTAGLLLWAAMAGEWLAVLVLIVGTLAGLYAFVRYGEHFDATLFWAVLRAHRARWNGFSGAAQLFTQWKLVALPFGYYPFLIGVVGILEGLRDERSRPFFAHYVVYLGVMTFLVDQNQVWGWYVIPVIPAVCMGIGRFTMRMLDDGTATRLFLWALLCVPYMAQVLLDHYPKRGVRLRYGYAVVFALVSGLLVWCARRPGARSRRVALATAATFVGLLATCDAMFLVWRWPLPAKEPAVSATNPPWLTPSPRPFVEFPIPTPTPTPLPRHKHRAKHTAE